MKPGDWIALPSKLKRAAIHFAEITSGYHYDPKAGDPFYHFLEVKWIATDIPRSVFGQDLLYSMGAFLTICRIERNRAEARIRAIGEAGWKGEGTKQPKPGGHGRGTRACGLQLMHPPQMQEARPRISRKLRKTQVTSTLK